MHHCKKIEPFSIFEEFATYDSAIAPSSFQNLVILILVFPFSLETPSFSVRDITNYVNEVCFHRIIYIWFYGFVIRQPGALYMIKII